MPTGIYKHRKGYHLTKDHKQKIGRANKGKIPWCEGKVCPQISKALKGHYVSKETRNKIGEAQKGIKNHNWQGGINPENRKLRQGIEFRLWREAIFARDNWTCQKCRQQGGTLHPHHKDNFAEFPKLRFAIDNGITLCKECHNEFHNIYGRYHNIKEQLEKYLKEDYNVNNN